LHQSSIQHPLQVNAEFEIHTRLGQEAGYGLAGKPVLIRVEDIKPNGFNPNSMPREIYRVLLEDMRQGGVEAINPITVRPVERRPPFEIVDGESRWNAAQELQWSMIRAEVRRLSLEEAKAECYRKNRERGHINLFKEAELFESEVESGLSYRKVASKYGVSSGYVYESLKLLSELHPEIQRRARVLFTRVDSPLTRTHLEVLTRVRNKAQQLILFEKIVGVGRRPLSSRELEIERQRLARPPETCHVSPEELYLENIWPAEPERDGTYGSSTFPGNCAPSLCKQCLHRYTRVGETVLDPMAGSGTMVDVAKALERACIAFDINPVAYRNDIQHADARQLPLKDASVDFAFLHFPYWRMYAYSDPPVAGDLSAMDYEDFLRGCEEVLHETQRVLKPQRVAAVLIGEMRKRLKFYDLPAELSVVGRRAGFQLHDKVVKTIANERSNNLHSRMLARRYNFHLIKVETLLIFKKPA
jgi:ParB/RepB/Spo0J family partition protein